MKTSYQLFKKYLDNFEKDGNFLECSKIEDDHGSLLLKYNDRIICDTSQYGNLVNPHQCNDMNFLRFAFEIVRYGMAIAYGKRYNKSKFREMIEFLWDLESYPITPGKWHVKFEYNGWQELVAEDGSSICHNSYRFYAGYLYWIFAKTPEIYKCLSGLYMTENNNLLMSSLKNIMADLIEDFNKFYSE